MICKSAYCGFCSVACCGRFLHNSVLMWTIYLFFVHALFIFVETNFCMAKIETYISSLINDSGKSELLFRVTVTRTNRFRVKSGIFAYPERFKNGEIKPQRAEDKEGRRKEMLTAIEKLSSLRVFIGGCCEQNKEISKNELSIEIDKFHNPEKYKEEFKPILLDERIALYAEQAYKDGIFGESGWKQYKVIGKEVKRFLIIHNLSDMTAKEFKRDEIALFREFLVNEYKFVENWRGLYTDMLERNIPSKPRSQNTVAGKMKKLQSFFSELESTDEVDVNPFRKIRKQYKEAIMKEQYDSPIYLQKEEFAKIRSTSVPETLQESKDAFLLQCALGCRIGDFQTLSMDNVSVRNGIPYVHYSPQKTRKQGTERKEIETPLVRFALDIIKKYDFNFGILKYVQGKSGYNAKIKDILRHCEIERRVATFDVSSNTNLYVPLCDIGSSKLARKTFVDMLHKVQIDKYASGLHSKNSREVDRYTNLELKDRFALMCVAFGCKEYKVDNELNII